jgi:hypothetical protein
LAGQPVGASAKSQTSTGDLQTLGADSVASSTAGEGEAPEGRSGGNRSEQKLYVGVILMYARELIMN